MTTPSAINSIDDICRLLDANPQWQAALSQRLRGPEQAAIQEQLNQATALAATTAQTTAENSRLIQEIAVKQDRNAAQIAENSRFMAQLSAKVDHNAEQIAELRQTTTELSAKVDLNTANIANLVILSRNNLTRMSRIESDSGKLKSLLTEAQADDIMLSVAYRLDWREPVRIHKAELIQLVHNQDINRDLRLSFIEADLVFRAQDPQGHQTCCAVELSWTVNRWDLTRARRNAELLSQITGCPAQAGVYGERYEWHLDWTDVLWFPKQPDQWEPPEAVL